MRHKVEKQDAAFQALALAMELAKDSLPIFPSRSVAIYTADTQILSYCRITDRHDNAEACQVVCSTIASTLLLHPDTSISLQPIPGTISFHPLKHIQEIAIEAAATAHKETILLAPTIPALRDIPTRSHLGLGTDLARQPTSRPSIQGTHAPPIRPTPRLHAGYR
jgi:hypothetical protein